MQSLMEQLAIDAQGMPFGSKMFAGLQVTVFSMVIVFLVLMLLMYIIKVMGSLIVAQEKKKAQIPATPAAPAVSAPVETAKKDDSEAIAAVIAAVTSAYVGTDVKIVIKDVVKKQDNWGTVGLLEQMNSRL